MSGEVGRIRIGASFDPVNASRFKLGIIRIERTTVAILAVIEAGLIDYVEQPRLWRRTESGFEWSEDPVIERRLALAEREQKAIEKPYTMVYPWAAVEDRAEVQRFLGTTKGPALQDMTRLRELAGTNPRSFILRYLYGAALQDAGDFVSAASEFEEAWSLRHDAHDMWSRLEGIYKSWDESRLESFYRRSMERDPENYVVVHNLGMLYSRLGRNEDALECFRQAHGLKPERFIAAFNGANALLNSLWRKSGNRPGPGAIESRTLNGHGDGQETGSATGVAAVGDDGGFADECGASILRASEPGPG